MPVRLTIPTLRLVTVVTTIVLVVAVAATGVLADEHRPKLGIAPLDQTSNFFDLDLQPGTIRELVVELANHGTEPIVARTYAADAYTLINGGMGVRLRAEPTSGPTRWIDYPTTTLELQPGQAIRRSFAVTVPDDTSPGAYVAALVIQNDQPIQDAASDDVALDHVVRQAIAVAVTVPGPLAPALTIGDQAVHHPTGSRSAVRVPIDNPGNVHLRPHGELTLHDQAGTRIVHSPLTLDTVYAATATHVEVVLADRLPPGDYTVDIDLADPDHNVTATAASLPLHVAAPAATGDSSGRAGGLTPVLRTLVDDAGIPAWAALVAMLVVLVAAGTVWVARRRRRLRRTVPKPLVQPVVAARPDPPAPAPQRVEPPATPAPAAASPDRAVARPADDLDTLDNLFGHAPADRQANSLTHAHATAVARTAVVRDSSEASFLPAAPKDPATTGPSAPAPAIDRMRFAARPPNRRRHKPPRR